MKRLLFIAILLGGCESIFPYEVDPLLEPYLHDFKVEAGKRGVNIRTKNIILTFDDFNGYQSPWGKTYKKRPGTIDIKVNSNVAGPGSPDYLLRYIVFHELGHAYLDRDHNHTLDENGHCASIMGYCGGNAIKIPMETNYNQLLDELFSK